MGLRQFAGVAAIGTVLAALASPSFAQSDKPILIGISGDKESYEAAKTFLENRSVPVYLPVEGACEALSTMYRCSRFISR